MDKHLPQAGTAAGLRLFFVAVYGLLLWINAASVDFAAAARIGVGAQLFIVNAWLGYNLMYLAPALLLSWLAGRPRLWRRLGGPRAARRAAQLTAVAGGALTTLFFYLNSQLHALYGMFVNGFVLNLVSTPGGLESLGGSTASSLGFALIALGCVLAHALLLWAAQRLAAARPQPAGRRWGMALVVAVLLSGVADRAAYAWTNAFGHTDMLVLTQGVPYYTGMTARHLFRRLGYTVAPQETGVSFKGQLDYPRHPLRVVPPARPYNVVWLVSESWRADTLTDDIMPATRAFARRAQDFRLHYSGGNGTRVGVFTMLTGVPGSYWQPFLEARRGAPLIDVLQQQGYQMSLYTSARFSYPEFDQTVFSRVPAAQRHEIAGPGAGWQKDRQNVGDMLRFIDRRDPGKPFFTFMFFESPHARYYFPPESVIRRPYRDDINYATLDRGELREDIGLIKNRYLNAVHHLDSQFARVIDHLAARGLLDSTIVVMVGDHGEEFMEHGYWGHNSTFSDAQTRTPLVLWVPGRAPKVHGQLTSHLDLPATLLPLLGVRNPVADYALGLDLLGEERHEHVILSDWSSVGYVDYGAKIRLPLNAQGFINRQISDAHDRMLGAEAAARLLQAEQPHLTRMLAELGHFTRKRQ